MVVHGYNHKGEMKAGEWQLGLACTTEWAQVLSMILSQKDKSFNNVTQLKSYLVCMWSSALPYMLNILDTQYFLIIPIILQTIKTLLLLLYKWGKSRLWKPVTCLNFSTRTKFNYHYNSVNRYPPLFNV